jgi:tRNA(Ile)-lysidine synthase
MSRRPAPPSLTSVLLARCTFPPHGAAVACALSGGADSAALVVLAAAAGLRVEAIHVEHGLRPEAAGEADLAAAIARRAGASFRSVRVEVAPGPNLEARARAARYAALPDGVLTGHTADDQAETVLLQLLRGAGLDGLGGIAPGVRRPLLALRRHETRTLCAELGLVTADDASNRDRRFRRNRVRHELLPLLDAIAERDVVPVLTRQADLLRAERDLLDGLALELDPTDARALAVAPVALARRAVRRWLAVGGYPPDAASVERVLAVARGESTSCDLTAGRRVARRQQRLRIIAAEPPAGPRTG